MGHSKDGVSRMTTCDSWRKEKDLIRRRWSLKCTSGKWGVTWNVTVATYGHRLELILTSGDPVHIFALTPRWAGTQGYTDRRHCLDSCNSLQWSAHSLWARGCHSDQLWMTKGNECEDLMQVLGVTLEEYCTVQTPRHWTWVPLQRPLDIHSRTREPTKVYPVLQEKMAVAP